MEPCLDSIACSGRVPAATQSSIQVTTAGDDPCTVFCTPVFARRISLSSGEEWGWRCPVSLVPRRRLWLPRLQVHEARGHDAITSGTMSTAECITNSLPHPCTAVPCPEGAECRQEMCAVRRRRVLPVPGQLQNLHPVSKYGAAGAPCSPTR
jgi:hypothetical protein